MVMVTCGFYRPQLMKSSSDGEHNRSTPATLLVSTVFGRENGLQRQQNWIFKTETFLTETACANACQGSRSLTGNLENSTKESSWMPTEKPSMFLVWRNVCIEDHRIMTTVVFPKRMCVTVDGTAFENRVQLGANPTRCKQGRLKHKTSVPHSLFD